MQSPNVAILVKSYSARNFKDLPPTQRCIDSVYIDGVRSEALQLSSFYKKGASSHLGGRVGLHCRNCGSMASSPKAPSSSASNRLGILKASSQSLSLTASARRFAVEDSKQNDAASSFQV